QVRGDADPAHAGRQHPDRTVGVNPDQAEVAIGVEVSEIAEHGPVDIVHRRPQDGGLRNATALLWLTTSINSAAEITRITTASPIEPGSGCLSDTFSIRNRTIIQKMPLQQKTASSRTRSLTSNMADLRTRAAGSHVFTVPRSCLTLGHDRVTSRRAR